ncbi:MAG: histidinol-phosphate transaminase [Chromatiales bacterium]
MSGSTVDRLIARWVRPEIREIAAYAVPDASGLIKLDAMENPYTWPEDLRGEWSDLLAGVDVNRYPDPRAGALKAALREAMGVPEGMGLLLGNGSDEIIQMLAMTLAAPGRSVLSVDPGFVMYRMIATFCGMGYAGVPLRTDDFGLDLPATLRAIETHRPALVFLAYPNNPTGNLFDESAMLSIIDASPGLVVVDEAYAPFTDRSFMSRLGEHPNLLVMRTLSKMGLAGLRLGLLAGPAEWLAQIDKTRLPYNVNVLTQAGAALALRHREVLERQAGAIRAERGRLFSALAGMDGIRAYPSEANFILFRVPGGRATEVFEGVKAGGVLIKKMDGAHPLLADCLRVTVGTPGENAAFLEALGAVL